MDYQQYTKNWIMGIRRYLLKLDDKSLPEAKRKFTVLFWVDLIVKTLFFTGILLMMYKGLVTTYRKQTIDKPDFVDFQMK